jgi:hypothetical protein
MKRFLMLLVLVVFVLVMSIADLPNSSWRLGFVKNAAAIIGMPRTPLSYAGVARRSVYRGAAVATTAAVTSAAVTSAAAANAAAANAAAASANAAAASAAAQPAPAPGAAVPVGTIVPNLPSGCSSIVISGVNYFNCAGVYYRAGFQGNNVVYIVSAP